VEEVVARLEQVLTDRTEARRRGLRGAETMAGRPWAARARGLKEIMLSLV
jgi:hypothetical protein